MKILVCDDERTRGEDAVEAISSTGLDLEVERLFADDLREAIESLVERGRSFLENSRPASSLEAKLAFDEPGIDLVILDNNLAELRIQGARHTAEALAGHIRAFTAIPYVVSLNKNPQTDFDLRFLVGDYETKTDLALNTDHLGLQGLWTGEPGPEDGCFLPWYWPVLGVEPAKRSLQEGFVESHLKEAMLESLGFSEGVVTRLARHAKGAISSQAQDNAALASVTFLDFFMQSCHSLPIEKERQNVVRRLASGDEREQRAARAVVVRVVAAELDRWFRRDVSGPQAMLVDLPHLLTRMPFLLGEGASSVEGWNAAVESRLEPLEVVDGSFRDHLEAAAFPYRCWTKVPSFWWPLLKADEELNASFFEDHLDWADALFCEDVSRFRSASREPAPREFAAEFEGAWNRRQVAWLADRSYTPGSRFAL